MVAMVAMAAMVAMVDMVDTISHTHMMDTIDHMDIVVMATIITELLNCEAYFHGFFFAISSFILS